FDSWLTSPLRGLLRNVLTFLKNRTKKKACPCACPCAWPLPITCALAGSFPSARALLLLALNCCSCPVPALALVPVLVRALLDVVERNRRWQHHAFLEGDLHEARRGVCTLQAMTKDDEATSNPFLGIRAPEANQGLPLTDVRNQAPAVLERDDRLELL